MIKKKVWGPTCFSSRPGSSTGRSSGRFENVELSRKDRDSSRSLTSGRTKTTTKDNYCGMTGPRTGSQKQDHGFQDLNLPLGTQEGTQDSSNSRTMTRAAASGIMVLEFDSDFHKKMADMEEGLIQAAQIKKMIEAGKRERERGKSEGEGLYKKEEGDQKKTKGTEEGRETLEDWFNRTSGKRTKPTGWQWDLRRRRAMMRMRRKADEVGVILRGLLPSHTSIYLLLVCMGLGMYAWAGGGMDSKRLDEIRMTRISVAPALAQQQQPQQHDHSRGGGSNSNNTEERGER